MQSSAWSSLVDQVPLDENMRGHAEADVYIHNSGHKNFVYAVAIAADGAFVLSGSADDTIRVWERDVDGYKTCTRVLEGHGDSVNHIATLANRCVSASDDKTCKTWDFTSDNGNRALVTMSRHSGWVWGCCIRPLDENAEFPCASAALENSESYDPKWPAIASAGGTDHEVLCWSWDGTVAMQHDGHTDTVYDLAATHDFLFSAGGREIRVWRWDTPGCIAILNLQNAHSVALRCLPTIRDNIVVLGGGNGLCAFILDADQLRRDHKIDGIEARDPTASASCAPTGEFIGTGVSEHGIVVGARGNNGLQIITWNWLFHTSALVQSLVDSDHADVLCVPLSEKAGNYFHVAVAGPLIAAGGEDNFVHIIKPKDNHMVKS